MFGISFYLLYHYYSSPNWDCHEISGFPHDLSESHWLWETHATDPETQTDRLLHTCLMRPCCDCERPIGLSWQSHVAVSRVTVSLLCSLSESQGELASGRSRISTSQISVIFYGTSSPDTASLIVIAALWGLIVATCLSSERLLSSSIELARPSLGLQIASCWLVGVGY